MDVSTPVSDPFPSKHDHQKSLSTFLGSQRSKYLQDIKDGKGKDWIVVMGNEAGDLDSIASSIGYAFLVTADETSPKYVPLLQTARADLTLRPENIEAFKLSSLSSDHQELLCIDDIPSAKPFPSDKFVLVDHNRLGEDFKAPEGGEAETVIAVLDHHEDEKLYPDANPRVIDTKAGSCSSLVVTHFKDSKKWDADIANLLLSAGCIDTSGLKSGGKATDVDIKAADFTLPIASNSPGQDFGPDISQSKFIKNLTKFLSEKKDDVGGFSNRDLLRRDYKQDEFASTPPSTKPKIAVGLSTVPIDLKKWVRRDPQALALWMDERKITVLGALASFKRINRSKLGGKKKTHKRQTLWMVHPDAPADLDEVLWKGLEGSEKLLLKEMKKWKKMGMTKLEGLRVKVYKQENASVSRKVVAPLVKDIIDGYLATPAEVSE